MIETSTGYYLFVLRLLLYSEILQINYFIIGYKWFTGCNVSQCFVIFIASAISFSSDNL